LPLSAGPAYHSGGGNLVRRLLIVLAGVAFVAGCREMAMPPPGSYSELLLVTEEGAGGEWASLLTPILGAEHDYVTSMESYFDISQVRAADMPEMPETKNVVICGVMDSGTHVGSLILSLIGDRSVQRVAEGQATVLKKENTPAPGQMTLIVTAPTAEGLREVIRTRGDELPEIVESSNRERLRRYLLSTPNRSLTERLRRKYGFTIEVPSYYRLFSESDDPPGVELLYEPPTRDLGVFWVDRKEPPSIYRPDELFDLRASYVWERYDHDKMDRNHVRYTWTRFAVYNALRMSGYWYNDKVTAGGYFETYFVYDPDAQLLWAVDILTYAPGRPKHPLVRELLALAETFRYGQ
jgi:hypothetical protein